MATTQDLIDEYAGQLVPFSFRAGFVCLSYAISLLGTGSTLELMRRRTSHRGAHNLMLLFGSAISMGGIAIWSMHFIGNRAIYMLNGDEKLQISYSTGMTVLSLLVPILVLLLAFLAVSGSGRVRWWRIGVAGLLSGGAICGMHYLADASISNYVPLYRIGYVVGAALIAVSASTAALAIFFVFEAAWRIVWWKRIGCAMVLAGAVSGMHWCAAVGTSYRMLQIRTAQTGMSPQQTLIMVIVLSVAACIVLTASGVYSSWIRRDYASKAQQVVLAAAVFDGQGRILVNQEGYLPSEVVTDTFVPKSNDEIFGTTHPLFHWMFRASRNWASVANLVNRMANHINYLSRQQNNTRMTMNLVTEDGSLVQHYDTILCELFTLAAVGLASKTKEALTNAGILWDEIFTTGGSSNLLSLATGRATGTSKDESMAEKGVDAAGDQYGRGCLMFLVRRVSTRRDTEKLQAAGYRFAEIREVSGTIRASMKIKTPDFAARLRSMSAHCERSTVLDPGVHLGLFAVRARLDHSGFDVLVQKEARNLIPTAALPLQRLEPWQLRFLDRLHGLSPSAIRKMLDSSDGMSPQESRFASDLRAAMSTLEQSIGNAAFGEATLMPRVVQVPCAVGEGNSRLSTCSVISFRMVLPIHTSARFPDCEFIPLNFFGVQQLVYEGSPHHVEFSHMVHRDLSSVLHGVPSTRPDDTHSSTQQSHSPRAMAWLKSVMPARRDRQSAAKRPSKSQEDLSAVVSDQGSSCHRSDDISLSEYNNGQPPGGMSSIGDVMGHKANLAAPEKQQFGGIMVSQEITVDVKEMKTNVESPAADSSAGGQDNTRNRAESVAQQEHSFAAIAIGDVGGMGAKEQRGLTFIDMFAMCMDKSQY